jgi:hypothetical protein
MKLNDKISFLCDKHGDLWNRTVQEIENTLSAQQSMFCVCGKLATGFHESNCYKFRKKVWQETVKKLEYLIK